MAELFGFTIQRSNKDRGGEVSFSTPTPDDGTIDVAGGGFFGQILDTDGRERSDLDLIRRYRDIAQQAECDTAIEDIVNEGIVSNQNDQAVEVSLDRLPYPDKIKRKIRAEFDHIKKLLNFDQRAHEIVRSWYIDGRIFYHKVIDLDNPKKGLLELRYIDPMKIKKVRQKIDNTPKDSLAKAAIKGTALEYEYGTFVDYYLYNPKGFYKGGVLGPVGDMSLSQGVKIAVDSITFIPSGLQDLNKRMTMSFLHKAIKSLNQLRMIEDALVIYRLSRAPERRIFYIDVGNLPKIKAEQYLRDAVSYTHLTLPTILLV